MRPTRSIRPTLPLRWTSRHGVIVLVLAASIQALALAVSCGGAGDAEEPGTGTDTSTVTVSAAASLTDVFTEVADGLMAHDPSLEVRLNFGSSGQLATQIREGAPVDVAAFADEPTMAELTGAELVDAPVVFATNRLAIVADPGNPLGVTSLEDLPRVAAEGGIVALCARDAPCGAFADEVLDRAGVSLPPESVTRSTNARSTLSAVSEGDADVAIVYVTDAVSAGDSVDLVRIPEPDNVVARYPVAVVSATEHPRAAQAFVDRVLGSQGREALERGGFGTP